MGEYHTLGLSGAIGSNIAHIKSNWLVHGHDKKKLPIYQQATVDRTGCILGATDGFANKNNEKTVIH